MSSSGKFYIQRGQAKRDEDVALGLQSSMLRDVASSDGHKVKEAGGDRILEAPYI